MIAPTRNLFAISHNSRVFHAKNAPTEIATDFDDEEEEEEEQIVSKNTPVAVTAESANPSPVGVSTGTPVESILAPPELWSVVFQGLGSNYEDVAQLPVWLDASKVESVDWK